KRAGMESVWTDGNHDLVGESSSARRGDKGGGIDWASHREHGDLHCGRGGGAGAGGGDGGGVHRGGGSSEGGLEEGRTNGGEVCAGWVQRSSRSEVVPDGGFGAVAWGWRGGVCGTEG